MIAFLSGLSADATALLAGIAAAAFWLTIRAHGLLRREKAVAFRHPEHPQPCRRCGARN